MNPPTPIIGVSKQILKIKELITHVAATGLNIVITGETGVGKEVVAQALYKESPRSSNAFIKVNCAALPETLLESELYGYEKGAFTGAQKKRRGKFQLAHKGVLFLDEIGDMPFALQSKILHVLQSGEYSPLGSEHEVKTDAWVITATNHHLEEKIKNNEFREDLYYRLNIIKIEIPPLRERPEDISPLIEYYIKRYSSIYPGQEIHKPDKKIMSKLNNFPWPGNVRQLQNCIKKQVALNDWKTVTDELENEARVAGLSISIDTNATNRKKDSMNSSLNPSPLISELLDISKNAENIFEDISFKKIKKKAIDRVEHEIILYVLERTSWNRSKAARILKISYKTLLYKIKELSLEPLS
ncbi:MAG: sigma-54 dependent transcriptional regulator [Thermodesulfobacteriota bacterium]|nr:sigma-54 dependent transcriptional regulator [Thermodesulfobacteriota bacterium]